MENILRLLSNTAYAFLTLEIFSGYRLFTVLYFALFAAALLITVNSLRRG